MNPPPPVQPNQPMRVMPADDGPFVTPRRPGIITAMGVIAIVVASLSLIANGISGLAAFGIVAVSKAQNAMFTPRYTATATVTVDPAVTGLPTNASTRSTLPRGLQPRHRLIVLEGLRAARPITDEQAEQLDALLAKRGEEMLPFAADKLTAQSVQANVSSHGALGRDEGVYFVLGNGKLELYIDRGAFFPTDGGEPVRVGKGIDDDAIDADEAADPSLRINPFGKLSADDVGEVVRSAERMSKNRLSTQQAATLRSELGDEEQKLILTNNQNLPAKDQVLSVVMNPDNSAMVTMYGGYLTIDPAGAITDSTQMANSRLMKVGAKGPVLVLLDASLGALLAVYLLVVGILVLRQTPRGWGLQLTYALLKLPLAVMGAIGWMWIVRDMVASSPTPISSAAPLGWLILLLVAGCTYPIALLAMLFLPSVREYYRGEKIAV